MKKAIKGYLSGMTQDGAKNKENQNSYFYARDFRVVTDKGKSTGSLENERGHKLSFIVPDLEEMTLTDGTVIPAQENLQIIGWCTIRDRIVIFTTNETAFEPTSSYGQIWALEINETNGDVINITAGNELTVADHLIYNQQLNFSSYHRIGRAVGRYETADIQRVYWTDNYNNVRVFNIAIEDSLNYPLDNVDLQPNASLSQPIIYSIDSGNLSTGCEIQFAYRLLDAGGAETLVSPVSALAPLPNESIYTGEYGEFTGQGSVGTKTKSVTYKIKDLDTDYTTIEHIAILYTAPDVFTVYKFDEQLIPSDGEVTVTCSDLDDAIILTNTEFNLLSSGFGKCKDIEVKDNRLIAANIKNEILDIDFDARAYRFDSTQEALLTDTVNGDITVDGATLLISSGTGTGTSWTNILEEHDAINPYNNENDPNWLTNNQYKYQADGTTLGGQGPNISYEFITKEMPGNFRGDITTNPDHVDVDRWTLADGDDTIPGQLHGDGSVYTIEKTNQLKNFASPANHSYFRGYARGETYRWGIVFLGKKGSYSFTKWIGDIRFPDVEDGFPVGDNDGGFAYLYNLGIRFDIDITSIKDQIEGYRFVRVKREESDKTKLGTGLLMLFDRQDETYETTLLHNWEATNDGAPGPSNPFQITNDVEIYGDVDEGGFHLADKPGFHDPQFVDSASKRYGYLISPMGQLYSVPFSAGDHFKTTGYHRAIANKYYLEPTSPDADKSYGFYFKTLNFIPYTHDRELFELNSQEIMDVGRYYAGNTVLSGFTTDSVRNASYCIELGGDNNTPLGLGSPKMIFTLTSTPTINNNTGDPATNMDWEGGGDYRAASFAGTDSTGFMLFKEIQYARYVDEQYGGNTYADRSKNQYISTNHFQIINDSLPDTFSTDVYGGDVFVNYYDDEQIQMYWNQSTAFGQPYKTPVNNKLSVAVVFPCESPVNADYREGRTWAANKDIANIGAYESNDYIYNFIWSQQNTAEQKFFAQDFLVNIFEESPHQLWASDVKVDGELIDSWRIFRTNNRTEVNGIYGPINRIINYKDRLFFYQDSGVGIASMNERSIITDQSGQQAVLGTGGIFPYYNYLSTITGCYHQFAVVPTETGLYHYDTRLRKMFKTSGGVQPISDIKGMSSFFDNHITSTINKEDRTLRTIDGGPTGVHGEADYRYNRVLFTFLKPYFELDLSNPQDFTKGQIIFNGGTYYEVLSDFTYNFASSPSITDYDVLILENYEPAYTVSYNEVLDAYESFYSYKPGLYLQYGRRLMSVNPFDQSEAYIHNEGNFCTFYNQPPTVSRLITYLGSSDNMTKIFNNLEYLSEVYDTNGNDIYTDTLTGFRLQNEYQDTNLIPLVNENNIRRRMRTWRYVVPRNSGGSDRIRNPWSELTLDYQNADNKRLVLHELIYDYTPTNM